MTVQFSHIIELDVEDEEAKLRASGMMLDPSDGQVYSKQQIIERNKPKPPKFDAEGNLEDDTVIRPLDLSTLVQRVENINIYIDVFMLFISDILGDI